MAKPIYLLLRTRITSTFRERKLREMPNPSFHRTRANTRAGASTSRYWSAMHVAEKYKELDGRGYKVLAVKMTSPDQVLQSAQGSIHASLAAEGLSHSIGIYFYRFEDLPKPEAFSKIGEVSRREGVLVRKQRGWLSTPKYGDSYLKPSTSGELKTIYSDVKLISTSNPMYFVFYEFDVLRSFPKIDEIAAFAKHRSHFGRGTRNKEQPNTFEQLGSALVWHSSAFDEVLAMKLPSGLSYERAI